MTRATAGWCERSVADVAGSILGTAVRRVEDPELITGRATYVGDLALPGVLHLHFVRSPMAHAELAAIDTAGRRRLRASSPCSPPRT